MTILITSCVWVTFFTILNQFEQRNYLTVQTQWDDLQRNYLTVQTQRDDLLTAMDELLYQGLSREPMVLDEVTRAWRTVRIAVDKAQDGLSQSPKEVSDG